MKTEASDRDLYRALRALLPVEELAKRLGVETSRVEALLSRLEGLLANDLPGYELTIHTDGAARGNPGPAGAGAVLIDQDGRLRAEVSVYLGECTNNVAEYRALELALEKAHELGVRSVRVRTDSALVARQLNGSFRVKNGSLVPLYQRVKELAGRFERFVIEEVSREHNKRADVLANNAIDAALAAKGSGV
ncbi:MAG: ribonuclease HI family protein [candidate division KSB1 bacterium]|nr:ribonuclease HI family protein [candidate division KSB1 bacterium]